MTENRKRKVKVTKLQTESKKTESKVDKVHLLGSNLDELLEKLHPLAELRTQTHLCDHPKLNFIKPPQEQVQVHGGLLHILPPKCVVDEFKLLDTKEKNTTDLLVNKTVNQLKVNQTKLTLCML